MNLNGIKITWLGHSTFLVVTPGGKNLILDPWVTGNPATPDDQKRFDKLDYMLCSHGHSDHFGDAVDLAKKHNPKIAGMYELCAFLQKKGAKQILPMNKGGTQQVGDIKVSLVNAHHSNTIDDDGASVPGGEPCGFVIEFENGFRLYHAGDTNVFGDMAIIRELYAPDLCMLPIGDLFTMGPKEAAYACTLLKPKAVIPMHYATFPVLTGTPEAFQKALKSRGVTTEVITMKPGETIS
jgi:L-ascorbate metabolism protein UlaG (beta-lactamase superfamily)